MTWIKQTPNIATLDSKTETILVALSETRMQSLKLHFLRVSPRELNVFDGLVAQSDRDRVPFLRLFKSFRPARISNFWSQIDSLRPLFDFWFSASCNFRLEEAGSSLRRRLQPWEPKQCWELIMWKFDEIWLWTKNHLRFGLTGKDFVILAADGQA